MVPTIEPSADHNGGNGHKRRSFASIGRAAGEASCPKYSGHPGQHGGDDVHEDSGPLNRNAGPHSRLEIATDGIEMLAKLRLGQNEPTDRGHEHGDKHYVRHKGHNVGQIGRDCGGW